MNVDDIVLTDFTGTSPTITVSSASITGLDYIAVTGPSAEQSFTVSGTNLTNYITLTAPTNFEISTTLGGGFGPNVTLTPTSGTAANTTIYKGLAGGLTNGNYTGNINATYWGNSAKCSSIGNSDCRCGDN